MFYQLCCFCFGRDEREFSQPVISLVEEVDDAQRDDESEVLIKINEHRKSFS
jgi:hypothetical protein